MVYRANERGKLSKDFVAAGDGLLAFGAVFILPVQTHYWIGKRAAGQWIYSKLEHAQAVLEADKQLQQIQPWRPNRPRSRAREAGASPQPHQRGRMPGHRSRGRAALPATPTPDPERRRRRLADERHGVAVARCRTAVADRSPAVFDGSLRYGRLQGRVRGAGQSERTALP